MILYRKTNGVTLLLTGLILASLVIPCQGEEQARFRIGWAEANITPDEPVMLSGQFHARVSEGVRDPVTATALAMESADGNRVVMVSCDLSTLTDFLRDAVREHLRRDLPELDPRSVIFNATHTHTAPYSAVGERYQENPDPDPLPYGVELPAMSAQSFVDFASRRIADAVISAWNEREPAAVAFGLEYAVVGRNRLISYRDGRSRMYGSTNNRRFSHVEGYEDHSLNILATYDADSSLTGLVINIACPPQASEGEWQVSADFWHETREELRRRHGDSLFILAQTSAAGDQSQRNLVERKAEERMWRLAGRNQRQEIGVRIADAVDRTLPLIRSEIDRDPLLAHHVEIVGLPRRRLSEKDVTEALKSSEEHRQRFQEMLAELEKNPQARENRRWYRNITRAYRQTRRGARVERRYQAQKRDPKLRVELHAVRLGDIAFLTNPFELYLDYGIQIKARSPATQTFLVQLAGPGSYVPTARSIAGGAYGAVPASTEIGVEGGEALVEWSLEVLSKMWRR